MPFFSSYWHEFNMFQERSLWHFEDSLDRFNEPPNDHSFIKKKKTFEWLHVFSAAYGSFTALHIENPPTGRRTACASSSSPTFLTFTAAARPQGRPAGTHTHTHTTPGGLSSISPQKEVAQSERERGREGEVLVNAHRHTECRALILGRGPRDALLDPRGPWGAWTLQRRRELTKPPWRRVLGRRSVISGLHRFVPFQSGILAQKNNNNNIK